MGCGYKIRDGVSRRELSLLFRLDPVSSFVDDDRQAASRLADIITRMCITVVRQCFPMFETGCVL
jgi:hypothetical protein